MDTALLKREERAVFALREVFRQYGYTQFKMNRFEEYDLYVRNKDFLVSDNVITFTDIGGKLLALRPDVTLSIIKNTPASLVGLRKVFYNENVYRVPKGADGFREIMQTGLECIGNIDDYAIFEVLMLAARSLRCISKEAVLDISNLDIVSRLIKALGLPDEETPRLLKCVAGKNAHEIAALSSALGGNKAATEVLTNLVTLSGAARVVLPKLKALLGPLFTSELSRLESIATALTDFGLGDMVRIDFSVVNDMSYYNGVVFRGFLREISSGILSGGQYDGLMEKMGRPFGGIGFAVYLDMLERFAREPNTMDVDTVILYESGVDLKRLASLVKRKTEAGARVLTLRDLPQHLRYGELIRLEAQEGKENA